MANTVEITFYEKTYGHCPSCVSQKKIVDAWVKKNPDSKINLEFKSAEENLNYLKEKHGEVLAAPVIEILRNGERHVVIGNNPDILADCLNGLDSVWDEL